MNVVPTHVGMEGAVRIEIISTSVIVWMGSWEITVRSVRFFKYLLHPVDSIL